MRTDAGGGIGAMVTLAPELAGSAAGKAGRARPKSLGSTAIWRWTSGMSGGGGSPKWYQLAGEGTSALDIGAPVGSDVYSPVDGSVVAIRPFVIQGKAYGSEIDIQPQNAPSVVVAVTQLVSDPALTVGTPV